MSNNQPATKLRDGRLTVTIWANATEDERTYYSVDLTKSYKDDADAWQETHSLNGDEVLKGARLLSRAYDEIVRLKQSA